VMVSKFGGLTTFEALACKLPIIGDALTHPMPQEERTASMIERTGAGVIVRNARDVVPLVGRLATDEVRYQGLRQAATAVGVPDATERIVRELERIMPAREATGPRPQPAEVAS
jgi:UDP-N-acetylglucosamine:LPS N-acetylglucosamine transferase